MKKLLAVAVAFALSSPVWAAAPGMGQSDSSDQKAGAAAADYSTINTTAIVASSIAGAAVLYSLVEDSSSGSDDAGGSDNGGGGEGGGTGTGGTTGTGG